MNVWKFVLAAAILFPSTTAFAQQRPMQDENFDWLLGSWVRTNGKEGQQTFEHWEKKNTTTYRGLSYTMQAGDTVWRETVVLHRRPKVWIFEVTQKGEQEAVKFQVTKAGKGNFICENEQNPFPKVVAYKAEGNTLHARISAGETAVDFVFKRVEQ